MKILITSGGTTVPIDPVRFIANMSTGRFGSHLAKAALEKNLEVIYLVSETGRSPLSAVVNFYEQDEAEITEQISALTAFSKSYGNQYIEYRYQDFENYLKQVEAVILNHQPDIIMLAAAVSDYRVANYSYQKIRSTEEAKIVLDDAPKVISKVRGWAKNAYIVGFKLLVDSSDEELISVATKLIKKNELDLVVANDLVVIRQGHHEVILVDSDGQRVKLTDQVADGVIDYILKRAGG